MATTEAPNDIILFHYPFSPYAHKITFYLALRGIPYAQCLQPPALPRNDLAALGINYRRIPLLSIGRDVYCDTRLILTQLEKRFPPSEYPAVSSPESSGLANLVDAFATEGGVFARAAQLMPSTLPILNDSTFTKDREDFTGRSWSKESIEKGRPEAIAHMRKIFDIIESVLLDGREWIAATKSASLADINAVWAFDWLFDLKGLPLNLFNDKIYPKTYGWVQRFRQAYKAAKSSAPKPVTLKGPDAIQHITSAQFTDEALVDDNDPTGLKEGDTVQVWPIDSGFSRKEQGRLVKLTKDEVAVAVQSKVGDREIRVHAPRWGFRIAKATDGAGAKL